MFCVLRALQKGCGYHLDLFVIALLVLVCSVLGLPLFVAATVQSLNHVKSLQKMSTCNAPGEMPKNYGCRYASPPLALKAAQRAGPVRPRPFAITDLTSEPLEARTSYMH